MNRQYVAITNGYNLDDYRHERKSFIAENKTEARHWVINHLDCSKDWTVIEFRNTSTVFTINEQERITP